MSHQENSVESTVQPGKIFQPCQTSGFYRLEDDMARLLQAQSVLRDMCSEIERDMARLLHSLQDMLHQEPNMNMNEERS